MDVQRAKQILESDEQFKVEHNGKPVWILSVNEQAQTAEVHAEGDPTVRAQIQVSQLEEK